MGPDGEDALFAFLQQKLQDWQSALNGYKPLADTGTYPGKEEIADGLLLVKKLLGLVTPATTSSSSSIARKRRCSTSLINSLILKQFYQSRSQPGKSCARRMTAFNSTVWSWNATRRRDERSHACGEILNAPSPYGLIREADGLITTVDTVNTVLVNERRQRAAAQIDEHLATLQQDIATAKGDRASRLRVCDRSKRCVGKSKRREPCSYHPGGNRGAARV